MKAAPADGRSLALGLALAVAASAGCSGGAPDPTVESVTPPSGSAATPTAITLAGDGFFVAGTWGCGGVAIEDEFEVFIGDQPASTVVRVDERTLTAVVPAGLAPGLYDVTVRAPYGDAAVLPGGFEVLGPFPRGLRVTATPAVSPLGTTTELLLEGVDGAGDVDPSWTPSGPVRLRAEPPADLWWSGPGVTDEGDEALVDPSAFADGVAALRVGHTAPGTRFRIFAAEEPAGPGARSGDTGASRSDPTWIEPRTAGGVSNETFVGSLRAFVFTDADGDGLVSVGDTVRWQLTLAAARLGIVDGTVTATLPVNAATAWADAAVTDNLPVSMCPTSLTMPPCTDGQGGTLVFVGRVENSGAGDTGQVHLDAVIDASPPPIVETELVLQTPDGTLRTRAGVVLGDRVANALLAFPDSLVAPLAGEVRVAARAYDGVWLGEPMLPIAFAPTADFTGSCAPSCVTDAAGLVPPQAFVAPAPGIHVIQLSSGPDLSAPLPIVAPDPAQAIDPLAGTVATLHLEGSAAALPAYLDRDDALRLVLVVRNASDQPLLPRVTLLLPPAGLEPGVPSVAGGTKPVATALGSLVEVGWAAPGLAPGEEARVELPLVIETSVRPVPLSVEWEVAGTLGDGFTVRRAGATSLELLSTGPAAISGLDVVAAAVPSIVGADQPVRLLVMMGNHAGLAVDAAGLTDPSSDTPSVALLEPAWRAFPAAAALLPAHAAVEVLPGRAIAAGTARLSVGATAVFADPPGAAAVAARVAAPVTVVAAPVPLAAGGYVTATLLEDATDDTIDPGDVLRVRVELPLAVEDPGLASLEVWLPVPHGARFRADSATGGATHDPATDRVGLAGASLASGEVLVFELDLELAPWLVEGTLLALEAHLAGAAAGGAMVDTRSGAGLVIGGAPIPAVVW